MEGIPGGWLLRPVGTAGPWGLTPGEVEPPLAKHIPLFGLEGLGTHFSPSLQQKLAASTVFIWQVVFIPKLHKANAFEEYAPTRKQLISAPLIIFLNMISSLVRM